MYTVYVMQIVHLPMVSFYFFKTTVRNKENNHVAAQKTWLLDLV